MSDKKVKRKRTVKEWFLGTEPEGSKVSVPDTINMLNDRKKQLDEISGTKPKKDKKKDKNK